VKKEDKDKCECAVSNRTGEHALLLPCFHSKLRLEQTNDRAALSGGESHFCRRAQFGKQHLWVLASARHCNGRVYRSALLLHFGNQPNSAGSCTFKVAFIHVFNKPVTESNSSLPSWLFAGKKKNYVHSDIAEEEPRLQERMFCSSYKEFGTQTASR